MVIYSAAALEQGLLRLFAACDVPVDQATIVAEHLVDAECRGVCSHGLIRAAQYVQAIQEHHVNLAAEVKVLRETAATAVLDGQRGFGQVMARRAMELAIRIARRNGVASITLKNCYHTGRLGSFTDWAAQQGFIAVMLVNSGGRGQWVAPFGGTEGRLATNPLSIAVPRGQDHPLVVDFATSIAPEGRIRSLLTSGKQLPLGWVIDHEGNPTTKPADLYGPPRGAILPFGGHKGFGLSIMVDLLAGVLSGAGGCTDSAASLTGVSDGVFLTVIDVSAFCPPEIFAQTVASVVRHVKSSPPAEGIAEVLVPGELEDRTRAQRLANGIPLDDGNWRLLQETAARLSMSAEQLFGPCLT